MAKRIRTKAPATGANKPAKAPKLFFAKVKGKNEWLSHDGHSFLITTDKAKAHAFSEKYVGEIAKSKWGNKSWEKQAAPAPAPAED